MENQFFVDNELLSPAALEKKHRLETDPSFRTNHMEYLEGMEVINSDVRDKVISQMRSYDETKYTAKDVAAALESETCSIEGLKALLSPAAEPFLEQMAQRARLETGKHFGNTVYLFTPLYIANYCENYCVYCGFNCYNKIRRMKLSAEQIEREMKVIADSGMEEILILTGESRAQSVQNGISAVSAEAKYLAIHDGARPLISSEEINRVLERAFETGAATLGTPVTDTIKVVNDDNLIVSTPVRSTLRAVQTPQVFDREMYEFALDKAGDELDSFTDDCSLIENLGVEIEVVEGSAENIKLTTPIDIIIAEAILNRRKQEQQ